MVKLWVLCPAVCISNGFSTPFQSSWSLVKFVLSVILPLNLTLFNGNAWGGIAGSDGSDGAGILIIASAIACQYCSVSIGITVRGNGLVFGSIEVASRGLQDFF